MKTTTRLIPALDQMVLDIPTVIGEDLSCHDTLITNLTLRATGYLTEEAFLSPFSYFKNLEKLEMFYFTGV